MAETSDWPSLVAEAREHLDRIDGTKVPEFVQVVAGWQTKRLVIDDIPDCVEIVSFGDEIPVAMVCHTEPCHIPIYRTDVRWVPATNGVLQ